MATVLVKKGFLSILWHSRFAGYFAGYFACLCRVFAASEGIAKHSKDPAKWKDLAKTLQVDFAMHCNVLQCNAGSLQCRVKNLQGLCNVFCNILQGKSDKVQGGG